MDKQYEEAAKLSYMGNEGASMLIPSYKLKTIYEIPLGFQPLGIASKFLDDGSTLLALAAYFEPAICLVRAVSEEMGLRLTVNWIRGVNYGDRSVRLFPDIFGPGDANRAQTVNFGPSGTLWVSRNADREFFVLSPPAEPSERWTLTDRKRLPGEGMLHSALLLKGGGSLITIESTFDLKEWFWVEYENFSERSRTKIDDFVYGIARSSMGLPVFITDCRAEGISGVFGEKGRRNDMILPGIYGNGLAFLRDGSAFVSRYGQSVSDNPFLNPGELVYIPAHYLHI